MRFLPNWCLTNRHPAFHDVESMTAIEQTAKVYAAMNELIKEHNEFMENMETRLSDLLKNIEEDHDVYNVAMRQEFQDFINIIDLKVVEMNKKIDDSVSYMSKNLEKTLKAEIQRYVNDKGIHVELEYDSDTESLNMNVKEV